MLPSEIFNYHLPEKNIAQMPLDRRDTSKLLVVNRASKTVIHSHFNQLSDFLTPDIDIFRNTVGVFKARLTCRRINGSEAECFLIRPANGLDTWWCLLRPGKKLLKETTFYITDVFEATILEHAHSMYKAQFRLKNHTSVFEMAQSIGQVPLPTYIHPSKAHTTHDQLYQTVYTDSAKHTAVAAPTAGFHFTDTLLNQLQAQGLQFYDIVLSVGMGTFQPLQSTYIQEHVMHTELYEIPSTTVARLSTPSSHKKLAVGTTTLRALEAYNQTFAASVSNQGTYLPFYGSTNLFIYPPTSITTVDYLITNFHQPKSTLMCLVAAFLTPGSTEGIQWLKNIYETAIAQEYRLLSYGDAMLIL